MGSAWRMGRMGKTTCNRLPIGLCGGCHGFPVAGSKAHEIFVGLAAKRVIGLISERGLSLTSAFLTHQIALQARRYTRDQLLHQLRLVYLFDRLQYLKIIFLE